MAGDMQKPPPGARFTLPTRDEWTRARDFAKIPKGYIKASMGDLLDQYAQIQKTKDGTKFAENVNHLSNAVVEYLAKLKKENKGTAKDAKGCSLQEFLEGMKTLLAELAKTGHNTMVARANANDKK